MTSAVERFVDSADGLALFYRDYPADGAVTGLPVVCIHGLTRNSKDFAGVAPRIASLGRRVLAVDVRGRGRSARDPDPSRYAVPIYAQDVVRVLDDAGAPRAVFLGTSMGGLITMTVAAFALPRIAAAILNDIGPVLEPAGLSRIAGYVGRTGRVESWADAAARIRAINEPAFPGKPDAFWLDFAQKTFREEPDGSISLDYDPAIANGFAAGAAPVVPPNLTPLFTALAAVPVMSVRGGLSDLLSAEGVAGMRAIKPDLACVEAANVGHAPTLEEPEVWEAMVDFLARVP